MNLLLNKQTKLKEIFTNCATQEAVYQTILEWGKKLSPFEDSWKSPEALVSGCQSVMFLHAEFKEGKLYFHAASDALISAGLAALLTYVYSGEPPQVVLTHPPTFLEEMGIVGSLSPSRANGLASLYVKMKKEALKALRLLVN